MKALELDVSMLESLYNGRAVYHGELHDHANTGGTSDGKRTLMHWKGAMEALGMDFATILDHKQVRHMYLPEWEDGLFISGTEPGTEISDSKATVKEMHYNMIFPSSKELENLLLEFTEYNFTGGAEGHFIYPSFTRARFCELIDAVFARGGFFVHPHPKQLMSCDDPLEYWFRDGMGIEVFYKDMRSQHTEANYKLWTDLLKLDKRVYATAGCDRHKCAQDTALTTIYAEEKTGASILPVLRAGDFVCGSVGIRMCVGNSKMGSTVDFDGKRLVISISDFHKSVKNPDHEYRLDIITDNGVVFSSNISCDEPISFAMNTEDVKFYRAEVFDVNENLRIAIGNPIWNAKKY